MIPVLEVAEPESGKEPHPDGKGAMITKSDGLAAEDIPGNGITTQPKHPNL
jgi:hypothetical protein